MLFKYYANAFRGKNHTSKRNIDKIFKNIEQAKDILGENDITFEKGLKYTKIQFNNKACYAKYFKANDSFMLAGDDFEALIDTLVKVNPNEPSDTHNDLEYDIFSSDEVITVDAYKKQLEKLSNNKIKFTIASESCKNLRIALQEFNKENNQSIDSSTKISQEEELASGA